MIDMKWFMGCWLAVALQATPLYAVNDGVELHCRAGKGVSIGASGRTGRAAAESVDLSVEYNIETNTIIKFDIINPHMHGEDQVYPLVSVLDDRLSLHVLYVALRDKSSYIDHPAIVVSTGPKIYSLYKLYTEHPILVSASLNYRASSMTAQKCDVRDKYHVRKW